jgi:hypothetical protein
MKSVTTFILIAVMLLQSSMHVVIVTYYQLNKTFIANNYCENKAKLSLRCEGKCYLGKKIETQRTQEKKQGISSAQKETVLFFVYGVSDLKVQGFFSENAQVFTHLPGFYSPVSLDIFQPPCAAVFNNSFC